VAAPVKMDEEVDLQIDSLAYGGNGVARLNGFVVFVRKGLPGDRVRARVTKVKRGFAEAIATDVLEPSPNRVEAPCTHYPVCGGCRFQDRLRRSGRGEGRSGSRRPAADRCIPEPPSS
jgi:23S rRNA (uracil1939-C5)-methyltransferase